MQVPLLKVKGSRKFHKRGIFRLYQVTLGTFCRVDSCKVIIRQLIHRFQSIATLGNRIQISIYILHSYDREIVTLL